MPAFAGKCASVALVVSDERFVRLIGVIHRCGKIKVRLSSCRLIICRTKRFGDLTVHLADMSTPNRQALLAITESRDL